MPIAKVQLPDGRIARFEVQEGTTPEQIEAFVASNLQQVQDQQPPAPSQFQGVQPDDLRDPLHGGNFQTGRGPAISTLTAPQQQIDPVERQRRQEQLSTIAGIPEAIATVTSGAVAEPVAGLAGIAGTILPGEEGQGAKFVEKTREALTFQPRTEAGQQTLQKTGELLEPVGSFFSKAEKAFGDSVFNATDSPTLAAAATTIPTVISEIVGGAAGKGALTATRNLKKARAAGKIAREIEEAVPNVDQLKDVARGIYKEIDETGAIINDDAFTSLSKSIESDLLKSGLDPDITPKAQKALQRFKELEGKPVTVTELDTLRKVAQNAAGAIEPAEAALGMRMINEVDRFMDAAGPKILRAADPKDVQGLGKKYKIARDLWGRARRSELLETAFEKARNQASGFENGVRVQFRSILNNKKTRRLFDKQELDAMTNVVRGGKAENIAKLIGRLGFSEGGATNILGGAAGAGAGALAFGPAGAVLVPLVGQVSRKLAQRMTAKGAEFADQVIRAGKDAKKITNAYMRNTPKDLRSPSELSQLLMRQDIDLDTLPVNNEVIKTAREIAQENRKILATSIAATEAAKAEQNE